ncbi:MAG: hypothetical protein AAF677_09275 [Pseudomonadota bacterium]
MRSASCLRAAAMAAAFAFVPAAVTAVAPSAAMAATLDWRLTVDGSGSRIPGTPNVPMFTLENLGEGTLVAFEITIGDTDFNFDGVTALSGPVGGTASIALGDASIFGTGTAVFDTIRLAFTGFDSGEQARFGLDVDADNGAVQQDYRTVLFNNGAADNAIATAFFQTQGIGSAVPVSLGFADVPASSGIVILESGPVAAHDVIPTPLPPAFLMGLAGVAGLAFVGRRRPG